MKKKKLIFPIVLCVLLLYRGLNQIGIRIESPQILVIVMCGLCVLTFYDFIVKFKIWLRYTEERDRIKKELKEFENTYDEREHKDKSM